MDYRRHDTHLELYDAYRAARADEVRLEAESKAIAERFGAVSPEHKAAEDRDEAASNRRFEVIDKIIATPATSPVVSYVQAQVLADQMIRNQTYDSGDYELRIVRALVAGLARQAIENPAPGGDDSALEAVERLHEDAYANWNAFAKCFPDDADLEESDDGFSEQAVAMLDAAALIPAAGPGGLGVKARLLASPHYGGPSPSLRRLKRSLYDDLKRLEPIDSAAAGSEP